MITAIFLRHSIILFLGLIQLGNCYWTGQNIVGAKYGTGVSGGAGGSKVGSISSLYPSGRMANLGPGLVNLGGEIVDTKNKVVQRVTGTGATQYFSYINQKSGPIFQTPTMDVGKHFVMFQDVNYIPGDGHYIILRRWRGSAMGGTNGGTLYEAFYLDLGDSVNALVSDWNFATYVPSLGNKMPGARGNRYRLASLT